jgi:hypothetical protein
MDGALLDPVGLDVVTVEARVEKALNLKEKERRVVVEEGSLLHGVTMQFPMLMVWLGRRAN